MGGHIEVESTLGRGSVFTVWLDLEAAPVETAPNAIDSIERNRSTLEDLSGIRILLVEDNEMNAEIAEDILSLYDAEVEHAGNGQIALEMFEESEVGYYSAILMDLRMPIMNGFDTATAIRALKRDDAMTTPIIALSADAFEEDVRRCLAHGMNAHIPKPLNVDLLLQTLSKYL
jgi:CheY-like chemotaxis protein